MTLHLAQFYQACDPDPIEMQNPEELRYYIDFTEVRGENVIQQLKNAIALSGNKPSCQLFTGHIGCGKSTELSRLESELTDAGFHVVYFRATEKDLNELDVDIPDILLAIAREVLTNLEQHKVVLEPKGLRAILKKTAEVLQTNIEIKDFDFSLPLGIWKITAAAKSSQPVRSQLRQYLGPQTSEILKYINEEIIDIANQQLQHKNKKGLVIIVDNLDRIQEDRTSVSTQVLPKYLFVDNADKLRAFRCHLVYTLPLSLIYSNERELLINRLGGGSSPIILPMVPVRSRDGREHSRGLELLRSMVLKRAFPEASFEESSTRIAEVFESGETLDKLCRVSGGHVRNLLAMLRDCLRQGTLPISDKVLNKVIKTKSEGLLLAINEDEWELLFKVEKEQKVKGDVEYQILLRSLFVFEYQNNDGSSWFGLNPLLFETDKYKSWKEQNSGAFQL